MPPPNLEGEALADWWRTNEGGMNNVKILSNDERVCPRCGDIQPCTGTNECTSCSNSLIGAKRRRRNLFQPQ